MGACMRTGRNGGGPWLPDIDVSIALAQAMHYEAEHRIPLRDLSDEALVRRSRCSDAVPGEPLTSRILARFRSVLYRLALTRSAAGNRPPRAVVSRQIIRRRKRLYAAERSELRPDRAV
jgi:hypothetical protein